MILILCGTILIIYIIMQRVVYSNAVKNFDRISEDKFPSLSIIVAARNEEKNIAECIEALSKLVFPKEKLEIIIVDDNSTDSTYKIVEEFIKYKPEFILIKSKNEIGNLKGKTNALANALEIAKGEVIATTDADCIMHPLWAKTLISYYKDDVGAVFGYTNMTEGKFFETMQSVDSVYLLAVAGGTMNMNMPMSCIGNNMSYRRKAYDEVGGYESLSFSITEDYRLLRALVALNKYKIIYPINENSLVTTKPCEDLKTLYRQRKRWSVGGLENDWRGHTLMLFGYLANLFLPLSLILSPWVLKFYIPLRFAADYFFLKQIYGKLNLKFTLRHLIIFEIYFLGYSLIIPFILMKSREVIWKDQKYK